MSRYRNIPVRTLEGKDYRKNALYPDIPVWVNDLYNPLYTFWCILRDRPEELYEILKGAKEDLGNVPCKKADKKEFEEYYDKGRTLFNQVKIEINHKESEDI